MALFLHVCNETRLYNSRTPRIKNVKFSGYYFYMNTTIYGDFLICVSVPLINFNTQKIISSLQFLWNMYTNVCCFKHCLSICLSLSYIWFAISKYGKYCFRKSCKKTLKLVKVVVTSRYWRLWYRSTKLFGSHKPCYDSQCHWPAVILSADQLHLSTKWQPNKKTLKYIENDEKTTTFQELILTVSWVIIYLRQSPRCVLKNFAKFTKNNLIRKQTLTQVFSCEFLRTDFL